MVGFIACEKKEEIKVEITSFTLTNCKDGGVLRLDEGEVFRIKYAITPEDLDTVPTWSSSDDKIASVDKKGRITAIRKGKAVVTGKLGKFSVTINVTVSELPITAVHFNGEVQTRLNGSEKVEFTTEPANQNPERIDWVIEDEEVASVHVEDGEVWVTGLQAGGTTKLFAKVGDNVLGEVTIKVVKTPVTSISLNEHNLRMNQGETFLLSATVNPADADDPTVTWKSTNPTVATVDNGLVTFSSSPAGGFTHIVATAGNKSDSCKVQFNKIDVTSVSISGASSYEKKVGSTLKLSATVSPSNATFPAVTWSSSNSSYATVDENGNVTLLATSAAINKTVKITATADGVKSSAVTITILPPTVTLSKSMTDFVVAEGGNSGDVWGLILEPNIPDAQATFTGNEYFTITPMGTRQAYIQAKSTPTTVDDFSKKTGKINIKIDNWYNENISVSRTITVADIIFSRSTDLKDAFPTYSGTQRISMPVWAWSGDIYILSKTGINIISRTSYGLDEDAKYFVHTRYLSSPLQFVTYNGKGLNSDGYVSYSGNIVAKYTNADGSATTNKLNVRASYLGIAIFSTCSGEAWGRNDQSVDIDNGEWIGESGTVTMRRATGTKNNDVHFANVGLRYYDNDGNKVVTTYFVNYYDISNDYTEYLWGKSAIFISKQYSSCTRTSNTGGILKANGGDPGSSRDIFTFKIGAQINGTTYSDHPTGEIRVETWDHSACDECGSTGCHSYSEIGWGKGTSSW